MADLIQSGAAWLRDRLLESASRTVTYQRGAVSVVISAVVDKSTFDVESGVGPAVQIETRDYLVDRADLDFGGVEIEPLAGDTVTEAGGAVYEVLAPAAGMEPWAWTDADKLMRRIYTKLLTC